LRSPEPPPVSHRTQDATRPGGGEGSGGVGAGARVGVGAEAIRRAEDPNNVIAASAQRAEEIATSVLAARLEFAFNGMPLSLVVSVALAMMTAFVLRHDAAPAVLITWLICLTSVNAGRLVQCFHYQGAAKAAKATPADESRADVSAFDRQLWLGCLAGGVMWGSSALLFMPKAPELQFFLAFVIAGVSSGAVTSFSVAPAAAYAFVVPCVLPLGVRFLFAGDLLHGFMGIMICFYIVVLTRVAQRGHLQLTRMVGSSLDAQQSRAALYSSDERLRVAADAGQIGVWEWDIPTGELRWDERMHAIYKVAPTASSDYFAVWRLRMHPADLARVEAELEGAVANATRFKSEFRILWPDGEERYIKAAANVLRNETGAARRLVGINHDVTELKRLERVKSEFMSTVSHELRTPLTSIRGSLGLVLNDAAGGIPDSPKALLRVADRNAERLSALIEDLLDVERIECNKLGLDLHNQPLLPLIRQALDANTPYAAQHAVTFELTHTAVEFMTHVDGQRIQQVMTNLLSNAIKFSPRESCVRVAITQPVPQTVRVSVIDQGPGISPQFQKRIFTLFSQGDASDTRQKGGTGLGLAISKALIEHMDGVIGFQANDAVGTTFFFELPVAIMATPAVERQPLQSVAR
jgi:signal transduction histidine kinase